MTLLKSWVASANSAATDFPLNNLPYGVFSTETLDPRCGVAIGDMILDLAAVEDAGMLELSEDLLFDVPFWNDVMEQGADVWAALRTRITAPKVLVRGRRWAHSRSFSMVETSAPSGSGITDGPRLTKARLTMLPTTKPINTAKVFRAIGFMIKLAPLKMWL